MTAEQFAAWLARTGWSDAQVAERLGVRRETVFRWRKGDRKVPGSVARLCGLLQGGAPSEERPADEG